MVDEIESLAAKLRRDTLGDAELFDDGEVDVVNGISADVIEARREPADVVGKLELRIALETSGVDDGPGTCRCHRHCPGLENAL
jgi:hypothetical protein